MFLGTYTYSPPRPVNLAVQRANICELLESYFAADLCLRCLAGQTMACSSDVDHQMCGVAMSPILHLL